MVAFPSEAWLCESRHQLSKSSVRHGCDCETNAEKMSHRSNIFTTSSQKSATRVPIAEEKGAKRRRSIGRRAKYQEYKRIQRAKECLVKNVSDGDLRTIRSRINQSHPIQHAGTQEDEAPGKHERYLEPKLERQRASAKVPTCPTGGHEEYRSGNRYSSIRFGSG